MIYDETAFKLDKVASAYHAVMALLLSVSVVSYFFGNRNLLFLWNFFNHQQLIVHFALLDLNMPANLFHTFTKCSQVLRYNIFEVEGAYQTLIASHEQDFDS